MPKILPLITEPNPILRQISSEIDEKTAKSKDFLDFCADLEKTMFKNDGLGIAAPQVGKNVRLFIVNTDDGPIHFINPKIIKKSWAKEEDEEGCLSVPKTFGRVKRHKKLVCAYTDIKGNKKKIEVSGTFARAIQHENDHLDGVLFIDKASDIRKIR